MKQKPEKVYNIYSGELENCFVGAGCQRHYHKPIDNEIFKARKAIGTAQFYDEEMDEQSSPINKIIIGVSAVGGASIALTTLAFGATLGAGFVTTAIISGLAITATALLGLRALFNIRSETAKVRLQALEEEKRKLEDANDDIINTEEYANPEEMNRLRKKD